MQLEFDVIIIGGGATGLGIAMESISRGYSTLLLEADDYGKGTSSKSTKLVHGGIRYLANLDFALVKEGLEERYYFLRNAPHVAHKQSYLIPLHNWFEKIQYFIGIHLYDLLAGKRKLGKSRFLSKAETLCEAPDLKAEHLSGGAIYYDGQFDDTRMLMTLLSTVTLAGGVAYNYHKVTKLIKDADGKLCGVEVNDELKNIKHEFKSKVIINATGTFTDNILNLDDSNKSHHIVTAAQGTHLVFDRQIFASKHALVIPKTIDGRILFVLPWHDKIIVGTTDIEVDSPSLDPKAQVAEIDFILDTLNKYINKIITRNDVRSVFAGQRPLVKPNNAGKSSAKISRKHEVILSKSGLISCVGGKWTIYRRMGEDTIDFAIKNGMLKSSCSVSKNLKLFGTQINSITTKYPLNVYGSAAKLILQIQVELNNFDKIHNNLPYYQAEVVYHIRYEQAKCLEDVLARRTRALFLDAKLAIEAAPLVAKLMARELNKDNKWIQQQLEKFYNIAEQYLVYF